MIQRVMAEEGVPQDLIYLAVAESGFKPRAINRRPRRRHVAVHAHGNYGLARNAYVDERFDPEKSTRAYARYMKFIYDQLGDWYLAMAAYDWGAGNMQRAVQKTGYADFWELYKRNNLPGETKNYVPEILAAIIIANHPTQYGFDDVTLDPPVLTDTVTINYSVDLRLVSDMVGAPVDELEALNPSLLRMVTPPDASFDLHLPAGTATLFEQRIAAIPEAKRNSWRYHRVAADDTLASVAREYRVLHRAPRRYAGHHRPFRRLLESSCAAGTAFPRASGWKPGRRLRVAEPAPVRTSSTHRRSRSSSEARIAATSTQSRQGARFRAVSPSPGLEKPTPKRPPADLENAQTHNSTHKSTRQPSRSVRKTAANSLFLCLCFSCLCVQAKVTIACASKMIPSAVRKCE
jgi:hypothetical protein